MSQISKATTAGNLPGNILLQVTADDSSTATPSSNNLNVKTSTVTTNSDNGIQTTASADTLTIELTNRLAGSGISTNAAPVDLITFALQSDNTKNGIYRFQFQVCGVSSAGANIGTGVGYTVDASARSNGTTATIIGTPFQDADEDPSLSSALIAVVASGNNIILRATGIPNSPGPVTETIKYTAVGTYVQLVV